jgi:hypothetical protein
MSNQGQKLVQCLNAISAYGEEIDALRETLNELFVKEIDRADSTFKNSGNQIYSERKDNHGWIYTDIANSFPLMGTEKRKVTEMHLSYQISLTGNGMSSHENDEPLLHVSLWADPINFDDEYCMSYPLEKDDSVSIEDKRLIVWGERNDDWKSANWTFSVRLLTLDSSQALLDRVIRPALKLLQGKSASEALPDNLPGLVLYPDNSALYAATENGLKAA